MQLCGLVVLLALWAVGCGDLAPDASTSPGDKDAGVVDSSSLDGAPTKAGDTSSPDGASMEEDSATDGGTFACGDASCSQTEVCVYDFCSFQIELLTTDGGSCPDGSAYVTGDSSTECIGPPVCDRPFCGLRSPSLDCFDQDGSGPEAILFRRSNGDSGRICYEAFRP
jgi:hypothetical protein